MMEAAEVRRRMHMNQSFLSLLNFFFCYLLQSAIYKITGIQ